MLVNDWMTKDVVTVTPETSMMKAAKLMKDRGVRRLPVVDESGALLGIVSDRDLKEASPSRATSLDMHELYYLLSEIKIKDIMTKHPLSVSPESTVEHAALVMLQYHVGGLPVVENGKLAGIITDSDIFKVLISITGAKVGGVQLGLELPDAEGSLKTVLDELRSFGARIVSILTNYETPEPGRQVYIRIHGLDEIQCRALREMIKARHKLLFWANEPGAAGL